MQDIGISIGEWSDNKYANFGSSQNLLIMGGISGFLPPFSSGQKNISMYGGTRGIQDRKDTAKILLDRGFSKDEISRLWANYKLDVQTAFDKDKFIAYADRKTIIDKARKEEDNRLYEQAKAQEEKEIMNDLNLFPNDRGIIPTPQPEPTPNPSVANTKSNNSPIPNELMGDKEKESQPNYLVYGLIGLGVIVGAFLIFKKK
jgi:hypothetical protein